VTGGPPELRRLAVNAIFLQRQMGGLETYVRELLPALLARDERLEITVFVTSAGREALAHEPWAGRVRFVSPGILRVPATKALAELTAVGRLADAADAQIVHSIAMIGPLRSRAASVVTVADVIWLREPDAVPPLTRLLWRTAVPLGARHARRVITLSEASRREISEDLRIDASRIDVVPLGPGSSAAEAATDEAELRTRLSLGAGPIVLTSSAHSPHKNVGALVEAMPAVRQAVRDAVLVIPGNVNEHTRGLQARAAELGLRDAAFFPGWVSVGDLEGLYRAAACFAFPSRREGFGLPVLEAMSRGVPVVCASAAALSEVAGDAALFFDPDRPDELAAAIVSVLQDPKLAETLRAAGRTRSASFSWNRVAEETLAVYGKALSA
jgi:glycosyltransferase involved in cell wall biosynthesis